MSVKTKNIVCPRCGTVMEYTRGLVSRYATYECPGCGHLTNDGVVS